MLKLASFLLKNSRGITLLALTAGLLAGFANTFAIGLINKGIEANVDASATLIYLFLGVCIVLPLTRVCSQLLLTRLSQKVIFDLRMHLARRLLTVPLRTLEKKGAGRLLTILTEDIHVISTALGSLPTAFMSVAIVLSGFGYMLYLYWPAAVITTVTVVVGVLIYALVTRIAQRYLIKAREDQDGLYGFFNGLIYGNKELKIHQKKSSYFMGEMVGGAAASYRRNQVRGDSWYEGAAGLGQLMLFVTVGVLVFALPHYAGDLPTAVLTGYAMILMYMMLPLESLTALVPLLSMAAISISKVEELGLAFEAASEGLDEHAEGHANWQSLTYSGLEHSYYREQEDEVFTMGPIDLAFVPGELVYLIGGNGSGKTTLAKLLLGLYIPEKGEIRLDGTLIDGENRNEFRQQFSAVFSDFFLFQDLMGLCPPEKEGQARSFLKQLHLDNKVTVADGRISSVELSQGQRKRLALLIAYLEDRPIYLFDEWAADQDPLFKDIFYNVLLPDLKARGKTIIAISHDDRYFAGADRIIKLDYGQLVLDTRDMDDLPVLFQPQSQKPAE